jgi:hypothetical protein
VQGRDSGPQLRKGFNTLEGISGARIARHGLPADLMVRIKISVKTWRRGAS